MVAEPVGARCPRCGVAAGAGDRFCTRCGYDLQAAPPRRLPTPLLQVPEPALVSCAVCEAPNAASRAACARCGAPLAATDGADVDGEAADEADGDPPAGIPDDGQPVALPHPRETSRAFVAVLLVAATAIAIALGALVGARGLAGGVREPRPLPGSADRLQVVGVAASSSLPPSGDVTYGPSNLVDGRLDTAWNEGVRGSGVGEWVELRLAEPAEVTRLLVWNGYQKPGAFADNARVRTIDIVAEGAHFTVDLLDVDGPQGIDLPEPLRTDRLRLVLVDVYPGLRYADAALSQVEVHGLRGGSAPAAGR